jgi:hypothetical protein
LNPGHFTSLGEPEVVSVDVARSADRSGQQRLDGVALAIVVVSVLADHDVQSRDFER